MYDWRKMSLEERQQATEARRSKRYPWHSPPHRYVEGTRNYLLTAACFEHKPHIAFTGERLDQFSERVMAVCADNCEKIHAWCVLPNHYHVAVQCADLKTLVHGIGRLHGRTSFGWNGEEGTRGRKVWYGCADREMRTYAHLMATINYVHHNPVRHGYVEHWQDCRGPVLIVI